MLYRLFAFVMVGMLLLIPSTSDARSMRQNEIALPNPILFVTQVPIPVDFATIGSAFANHHALMQATGRGGDLWIRYPDGTLKNLTETAGFGNAGRQGENAIAVRDPAVHWDGNKALFSMVVGAPTQQYQYIQRRWQIYEISGLGVNDTPVITKVANQPTDYNNISPIYGTDDKIIFTSDRPRNGAAHLYPQLDEYELTAVVSGIWRLDQATGELALLNHAPSGNFTPIIDSFGRVVFTQWDHLQGDQQADGDRDVTAGQPTIYGTFNYSDESAEAEMLYNVRTEVFPEPRGGMDGLPGGLLINGHTFNHFIPWEMNEDGTEIETLNHIGRHELFAYLGSSTGNDDNISEFYGQIPRFNQNSIGNMLQVREAPAALGTYIGTNAPEFATHAAGQLVSLNGTPSLNTSQMQITYISHPETANTSENPTAAHSGLYRDPLPLSDDSLLAVHTAETGEVENIGTRANPQSRYDFRIKTIVDGANGYQTAGTPITGGISKSVSYWDPGVLVSYSGPLWELQPVEVLARARPTQRQATLPAPEQQVFDATGVDTGALKAYLRERNLALIVARDVTTRDDLDVQQPFNLRAVNSDGEPIGTQSFGPNDGNGSPGKIYDVAYLQLFQADQLRGFGLIEPTDTPHAGRRVLAQAMHDPNAIEDTVLAENGPAGSVQIAADGSVAAFVPARRAVTWQLTDTDGHGIVRERNWLSFQPGEIRVCTSCHGINEVDQAGEAEPENQSEALRTLLLDWQANHGEQSVEPDVLGDVNCNQVADTTDALFILQYSVGQRNNSDGCPLSGNNSLHAAMGDVNNDQATGAIDALFILQCEVGLNNVFCPASEIEARAGQTAPVASGPVTVDLETAGNSVRLHASALVAAGMFDVHYENKAASFAGCASTGAAITVCHEVRPGVIRGSYIAPQDANRDGLLAELNFTVAAGGTINAVELAAIEVADSNGNPLSVGDSAQSPLDLYLPLFER